MCINFLKTANATIKGNCRDISVKFYHNYTIFKIQMFRKIFIILYFVKKLAILE